MSGGRVVLRDREGNLVDVSGDGLNLDDRARHLMAWLRSEAPAPAAAQASDGRHGAYDPGATAVIPAVRPRA